MKPKSVFIHNAFSYRFDFHRIFMDRSRSPVAVLVSAVPLPSLAVRNSFIGRRNGCILQIILRLGHLRPATLVHSRRRSQLDSHRLRTSR